MLLGFNPHLAGPCSCVRPAARVASVSRCPSQPPSNFRLQFWSMETDGMCKHPILLPEHVCSQPRDSEGDWRSPYRHGVQSSTSPLAISGRPKSDFHFNSLYSNCFSLDFFLQGYEVVMLSVSCHRFQRLNQSTDSHKTWYEHYATGGHPTSLFLISCNR